MKQSNLPHSTKKSANQTGELALKQIDNLGYWLSKLGIADNLNRHNCIALLITGDQRIKGEVSRLQLKLGIQKTKLQKKKQTVSDLLDQLSERAPSFLEKHLSGIRSRFDL